MTDIGDNAAADAAVLSESDASIMLIVLSGREAPCAPTAELLHVRKRVIAADKRLEVVKERLWLHLLQTPPRTSRKSSVFMVQKYTLQAEVASLEALLVNLEAEDRYIAANPYATHMLVEEQDGSNADTDRVVETGKEAKDAEDKEQDEDVEEQDNEIIHDYLANEESPQKTPAKPNTGRPEEQESPKRKRDETSGMTTPPGSFPSIRPSKKTAQKKIPNTEDKETALKKAPITRGK
jgi:hypothetical protein